MLFIVIEYKREFFLHICRNIAKFMMVEAWKLLILYMFRGYDSL